MRGPAVLRRNSGKKKKGAAATIAAPFPLDSLFKTQFISIFDPSVLGLLLLGELGVCVFSIALPKVDFGVGILAGPVCSVVGFTGVRVTITGFALLVVFKVVCDGLLVVLVVLVGRGFFPSLTEAGRGLVFLGAT